MRTILLAILIFICLLFFSCSEKSKPAETIFYYLVESDRHLPFIDTVKDNSPMQIDTADLLIAKSAFYVNKVEHGIYMYTSDNHAPVDGGSLYYTLDSPGIIYSRSTTWRSCARLQSNNDSINNLISQAFAHILLTPQLRCYQCRENDQSSKVIPPVKLEK